MNHNDIQEGRIALPTIPALTAKPTCRRVDCSDISPLLRSIFLIRSTPQWMAGAMTLATTLIGPGTGEVVSHGHILSVALQMMDGKPEDWRLGEAWLMVALNMDIR